MSRNQIAIAAAALVVLLVLAGGGYYFWGGDSDQTSVVPSSQPALQSIVQSPPQAGGGVSQPLIAVIDHDAILVHSKMGQDITRQIEAYADQVRKKLTAQRQAIVNEGATLQKQAPSLAPDVRQKRAAALDAEQRAFQEDLQRGDAQIKSALQQANATMAKALGPILEQIVKEHGANMLLDKRAVVESAGGTLDITNEAISRLDAKMTTYTAAPSSDTAPSMSLPPGQ
ncbi:MAG TPA: OmpH family outer membrane protein [Rhizomicrobium sp.]